MPRHLPLASPTAEPAPPSGSEFAAGRRGRDEAAGSADEDPEASARGIRSRTADGWRAAGSPGTAGEANPAEDPDPGDRTTDDGTSITDARPWWRTRRALAWMGAIAVVAIVGIAAVVWQAQAQGRVAVLYEDDIGGWPENVMGEPPDGARLFEDYVGLTAVMMPQMWGSGEGMECLYIVESGGQGFMSTIGCAAGGFPPTAALAVSDRGPDELQERFAEGTALQFVLRDGLVHVYVDEP